MPIVYPSSFPKLFEVRLVAQTIKMILTYGIKKRINQNQDFPITLSQIMEE